MGLSAALVLLVAILAGITLAGGGHPISAALPPAGTSSTSTASTATTVQLVPLAPSSVPTTAVPTTEPATTAPPAPTTLPPKAVSGAGAVLTAPPGVQRRTEDASGCASLSDAGWGNVQCGSAHAAGATLTWLTEQRPGASGVPAIRAYVFRSGGGADQTLILEAANDQRVAFSAVKVRVDAIAGDGYQDIAFGFHLPGSSARLLVDVVHGPGTVVVHRDLYDGVARTAPGQLDTWSAVLGPNDANCCPSSYEHDTIRYTSGAWRIVAQASVPPSEVPPSQL